MSLTDIKGYHEIPDTLQRSMFGAKQVTLARGDTMCAEDASKTMKSLDNPHTSIMHAAGVLQVRCMIVVACSNSSPKHQKCKVCGIDFCLAHCVFSHSS